MTIAPPTPMMVQWNECKEKAGDALLFFRLGDFYEAFHKDAEVIAKTLSLTLTARQGIPMCGVPFHTAEMYIDKLVARGFKVAVAEQIGTAVDTKGPMKREVARIVTPGTLVNSQLLSDKKNNYFASLAQVGNTFGLGILDLTTSQFVALELDSIQDVLDEIARYRPAEFLVSKQFEEAHPLFFKELSLSFPFLVNRKEPLALRFAGDVLFNHFKEFALKGKSAGIIAAGSLLSYLKEDMLINCDHILSIETDSLEYMGLDRSCLRNLELTESMHDAGQKNTLLDVIDHTLTPMGGRLLCNWMKHPLLSTKEIHARQEAISVFLENRKQSAEIRNRLGGVRDLERLIMRVQSKCASPRDVLSLGLSLSHIPEIQARLEKGTLGSIETLRPLFETIIKAFNESPPVRTTEGNIFKMGYHEELDSLKTLSKESTSFLARYQATLREQTGINSLKVGFTKAFGYYIEVSRGQSANVPSSFQRRQTLVNAERFITEELKNSEHQILSAEERAKALEATLFEELVTQIARFGKLIGSLAKEIGRLDCLLSLAKAAFEKKLIRPTVDMSNTLEIKEGRHLIVEHVVGASSFIANDTELNDKEQMMLITGPNMAGKSTYIRQVALIVILAQMGSFVPAKSAHIGIIDKVFSRIGASDDLARGQSTFMVEMTETANILQNATSRSLVLLDEIGRGTSTYDGISIAWAVAEFLLTEENSQAKTLFATHYWELTKLSDEFKNAANFQIAVKEIPSGIVFLRKIVRGGTDKSYGVHVAKLAGLPPKAIRRAEQMLKRLENTGPKTVLAKNEQLSFFEPVEKDVPPILEELKRLDPNQMTPIEALEKLIAWKRLT